MGSTKTCNKCKKEKNHSEFAKNKRIKDGRHTWCKLCVKIHKKPWKGQSEANREYFQANKERIKAERRKRYSEDLEFRISCNLRNRLSKMISGRIKNGSAIRDLGCSVEFFKKHLESLFQPGMNWENYGFGDGKWNIDHIAPLSKFDLSNREEFLKACHYTNLQPLWHLDNIRKSDIISI